MPQSTALNYKFYPGSAISSFFIYRQCKIRLSICCLANDDSNAKCLCCLHDLKTILVVHIKVVRSSYCSIIHNNIYYYFQYVDINCCAACLMCSPCKYGLVPNKFDTSCVHSSLLIPKVHYFFVEIIVVYCTDRCH